MTEVYSALAFVLILVALAKVIDNNKATAIQNDIVND